MIKKKETATFLAVSHVKVSHWFTEEPQGQYDEHWSWHYEMDYIWAQLKMNCLKWALTLTELDATDLISIIANTGPGERLETPSLHNAKFTIVEARGY
jgi:hypothetical protein